MKKMPYVIAAMILLVWLHLENTVLDITSYSLDQDKLPSRFDGFKIAQISDFHNTFNRQLKNRLVSSLKQENPDIIVITGDLIDSRRTSVNCAVKFVEQIKDIAPIYYVTGNHESRKTQYYDLQKKLLEMGVTILHDSLTVLSRETDSIDLIGLDDPCFSQLDTMEEETGNMMAWRINRIRDPDRYTIILCHRPELLKTYAGCNGDLVFCGHAHGGQIRLPHIAGLYAPHQGVLPKYTGGIYREGSTVMVVSRGIGNSLFPFRINNHPNLVIVQLHKD